MDTSDQIRDAISKAEHNKLSLEEFDHLYRHLKKVAHDETAPLLASGQKNYAATLNALLEGFHSLRPQVKEHEEAKASRRHSHKKDADE